MLKQHILKSGIIVCLIFSIWCALHAVNGIVVDTEQVDATSFRNYIQFSRGDTLKSNEVVDTLSSDDFGFLEEKYQSSVIVINQLKTKLDSCMISGRAGDSLRIFQIHHVIISLDSVHQHLYGQTVDSLKLKDFQLLAFNQAKLIIDMEDLIRQKCGPSDMTVVKSDTALMKKTVAIGVPDTILQSSNQGGC